MTALKVVIAPDSFKGSVSSEVAAAAISRGWLRVRPGDQVQVCPQADGGEGTLAALAQAIPQAQLHMTGEVTGPDGRPVENVWLELPGRIGVVELAFSSGLTLMEKLDPLRATTRGLGETIARVLDHGVDSLVIALGGSATTDGGAGALCALGMRLLDAEGDPVRDGGAELSRLARVDQADLRNPPRNGVTLLTDVVSPLLGPDGAAYRFGPQKGASRGEVAELDNALATFAKHLPGNPRLPGVGAAGGTAYGFVNAWGARIEPGARFVQRASGLIEAMAGAHIVITGEGRFDDSSMEGKVVGEILGLLRGTSVLGAVVVGQLAVSPEVWSLALDELAGDSDTAFHEPLIYLEQAGEQAAKELPKRLRDHDTQGRR